MRQTPSQDLNTLEHASWLAQRSSHSITLHEAQDPANLEPRPKIVEAAGVTSTNPALSTRIPNTWLASAVSLRSFDDLSLRPIAAR
jgi:hypothetical protein